MNKSLIELIYCQQKTQNNTKHILPVSHQSQGDYANDTSTNNMPMFDSKPELYFDLSLKLRNIAAGAK